MNATATFWESMAEKFKTKLNVTCQLVGAFVLVDDGDYLIWYGMVTWTQHPVHRKAIKLYWCIHTSSTAARFDSPLSLRQIPPWWSKKLTHWFSVVATSDKMLPQKQESMHFHMNAWSTLLSLSDHLAPLCLLIHLSVCLSFFPIYLHLLSSCMCVPHPLCLYVNTLLFPSSCSLSPSSNLSLKWHERIVKTTSLPLFEGDVCSSLWVDAHGCLHLLAPSSFFIT